MRHETVSANGLRFHVAIEGEGPLVLLLHGFPQCWYSWRRQLPALAAKGFRVAAPDLRGYGDSDKPRGVLNYRIDHLTADVAGLIGALGYEKAAVVGHDWGGGVAWAAALEYPKLVDRLAVLNCPHPKLFLRALRTNRAQLKRSWYIGFFQLPWLPEAVLKRDTGGLIAGSAVRKEAFTQEDRAYYTEAFRKPGAATGSLNYYRAMVWDPSVAKAITKDERKIASPTLVIWGDQDQALGKELTEGMEPLFSGPLAIRHVPDASHWIHEEQPELVNGLLADFLKN
jgi:pimeloyl-ACP methyl ester carboxylesterase